MLVQDRLTQAELTKPATVQPELPPVEAPVSQLGRAVVSFMFVAVGLLAAADLLGAAVPAMGYVALPLAIVGVGLVVGTWLGRARWLIVLGVIMSIALGIGTAASSAGSKGDVTWQPMKVEQMEASYHINIGNVVLDLSAVNFAGQQKSLDVSVGAGNLTILLPSNVDVKLQAKVDVGNAEVFGSGWNGVGQPVHYFNDDGADGIGGGQLTVQATVDVGNLEVRR